jgi:hypothetical protein
MEGRFLIDGQPGNEVTLDRPGGSGYSRAASLTRAAE